FAAGARSLLSQQFKNLRLENVPAGDREVGRRLACLWLLHHFGDRKRLALGRADTHDTVHVHPLFRYFFNRDDVSVAVKLLRRVNHLREAAARVLNQHVGQEQGEWFTADQLSSAPDCMAEPERRLLTSEAYCSGLR